MNKIILTAIALCLFTTSVIYAEGDHSGHSHGSIDESSSRESLDGPSSRTSLDGDSHDHDHGDHEEESHDHGKHEEEGHDHGKHEDKGHDHGKHEENGHDHGKHEEKGHAHGEHGEEEGHDGHDHGGGKAIGEGKAIVLVDENKGFSLSKEAIKTLSIKMEKIKKSVFHIDKKNLVTSKSKKGVYRFREGFFKFMPAKIISSKKGRYKVEVKGMNLGDHVVVNGVGLLRVSDVYSTDKSEYGHSH